jgi:hypothetical protein
MDAVIVGIVFLSIYKIIELFVRLSERRQMINKMGQVTPEMLQSNINSLHAAEIKKFHGNQFLPLRLGAAAIGIGFGWILGLWIRANMSVVQGYGYSDLDSVLIATTALCAGIALIIVYFIERKAVKGTKCSQ